MKREKLETEGGGVAFKQFRRAIFKHQQAVDRSAERAISKCAQSVPTPLRFAIVIQNIKTIRKF